MRFQFRMKHIKPMVLEMRKRGKTLPKQRAVAGQ